MLRGSLKLSGSLRTHNRMMSAGATQKVPTEDRLLTPMSLGFDMKYQVANGKGGSALRPLVVVAGWMGAKERQMKPYLNFYHERGIDTISFAVGPNHVLRPAKAMEQMVAVLNCISAAHNGHAKATAHSKHNIMIHKPSALVFHHFSVGGFLYGQALIAMEEHPHLKDIEPVIRAQIFDSPPDYARIPSGISKSLGEIGTVPEKII